MAGQAKQTVIIEQAVAWTTSTQTLVTAIDLVPCRIYGVGVSIRPRNSNGVTGQATNPRFTVYINDQLISAYTLNPEGGDSSEWWVTDYHPQNIEMSGGSNKLRVEWVADSVGGNGYSTNLRVTAFFSQI